MTLSQGDHLGRYEILGPIGAGGMGEVWRALDTELDRQVAVKVLPESFASDPSRLERFQREAKALAALSHPNLLDIYDVGAANGLHYAVTELLEGDTLRERITPTGLPWQRVTQIGAAVADGLAAAHGRGIVHRDLKPENLFLTADGRVKILDFGLAAMHEEAAPDAKTATITEAGTVMGTPGYMAPEQVTRVEGLDDLLTCALGLRRSLHPIRRRPRALIQVKSIQADRRPDQVARESLKPRVIVDADRHTVVDRATHRRAAASGRGRGNRRCGAAAPERGQDGLRPPAGRGGSQAAERRSKPDRRQLSSISVRSSDSNPSAIRNLMTLC